jgi:protein gp37
MAKAAAFGALDGQPRADKPWLDGCPRIIFVGDEGDLFDKTISLEYIRDEVYLAVTSPKGKRHQWMFLTKQARRMRLFFEETVWERAPFDAQNLWAGISATNQKTFDARVARLEETQVFSKYVSLEPMHGPIVLGTALDSLDLVIVGGESANAGTYRDASIFHLEWAEDIVKECAEAKVPVFVKQLGSYPLLGGLRYISTDPKDQRGEDWSTWPEAIRVRQMREAMLGLAVTPPEQGELLG